MELKQMHKAIPALEKARELKPTEPVTYYHLAKVYNESRQYGKTIEIAAAGVKVSKNPAGLYCYWGKALEKMERFDEAIEKFQMAEHDAQYGAYAAKQIRRQGDLKKIAQMKKEQL